VIRNIYEVEMPEPVIGTFKSRRWFKTDTWTLTTIYLTRKTSILWFFRSSGTIPLMTLSSQCSYYARQPTLTYLSNIAAIMGATMWTFRVWIYGGDPGDFYSQLGLKSCVVATIVSTLASLFTIWAVDIYGLPPLRIRFSFWERKKAHEFVWLIMRHDILTRQLGMSLGGDM
jgi:hypothetical protein